MNDMPRVSIADAAPEAYAAVSGVEAYIQRCGLEKSLIELVKMRASQINGCAFCLDMHNRDARAGGEDQRRLDVLSAWREARDLFTPAERAALAFTESVTLIADGGVPDDVWAEVREHFDEAGAVQLLMAAAVINVWNRLAVSTHQALPDVATAR
jgi:AhpD family alkylhydroperoxidase